MNNGTVNFMIPKLQSPSAPTAAILVGLFSVQAVAQASSSETGVTLGEFTVFPTAGVAVRYDDNLYESASDEKDSVVNIVDAGVAVRYENSASGWELGYRTEAGIYEYDSADNYVDHFLTGRGILQLGSRHRLELDADYAMAHQDRGTGLTQGGGELIAEPDEFDQGSLAATYVFGRDDAKGQLELTAAYRDLEYTNNRERTQFFDFDEQLISGTFFWRVFPKSSLLVQLSRNDIGYATDRPFEPSRDSTSDRLYTGLKWEATGKTTGTVKFGYLRKDFDEPGRQTFSAPSWEVEVEWAPRSYSTVTLETSRYDQETNLGGDFIDTKFYGVRWDHDWSGQWSTVVGLSYLDETFTNTQRTQESLRGDATLRYSMRRWLNWELTYRWDDRDASVDRLQFSRNRIELAARVAL